MTEAPFISHNPPGFLRRLYNWTLDKAAHRHALWWLAIISFVESSFFPIPPHPLLGLMCLSRPDRAIRYGLVCTIASVLGGLFGYAIGYFVFEAVGTQILSALGLASSFPSAACYLREYGWELILIKGATPIPFKLITLTAGFIHLDLFTFIWASIASRGFQFVLVGALFYFFGAPIKTFIDKYLGWVAGGFIVLVVGGFFLASAMTGGHGDKADKCSTVTSIEQLDAMP
ncbi:MAG: DedA family protein [Sphingomonadales bacterium]|nr:DedA family protein [Sphingomonadales bacterium]